MSIFTCTISSRDAESVTRFNLGELDSATVTSLETGKRLLVTHGSVHGRLLVEDPTVDAVACCHPCAVRAMNPGTPVMGQWVGNSRVDAVRHSRTSFQLIYGATQTVRDWWEAL